MRFKIREFAAAAVIVLVGILSSGQLQAGDLIIDDFESDTLEGWLGHNLKWVDGGPKEHEKQLFKLSINKDPKYVKQGAQSLRFECWAAEEEGYLLVAKQFSDELRKRLGEPGIAQNDTFTMWVYCKSGTGLIDMRLFAPGGKMVAAGLPINFEGWRQVTVTPADWRLEGLGKETAREIWDKLYLFYPY
ncbi:MAG: chondroitinase family protein, partial [Phycisphaerae bacterium]|nr:chondroitinase family protein [Phycisphaerae bacterium]